MNAGLKKFSIILCLAVCLLLTYSHLQSKSTQRYPNITMTIDKVIMDKFLLERDEFELVQGTDMYIRTAVYDPREEAALGYAVVRLWIITPRDHSHLFCHITTSHNTLDSQSVEGTIVYEPLRLAPYCGWLAGYVDCPWVSYQKPVLVAVSVAKNQVVSNSWHVIRAPLYEPPQTPSVGVCLSTMFDKTDSDFEAVLEWFEMQKLLGVHKVILYGTSNVSSSIQSLLKHYQDSGLLIVYPWKLPLKTYTRNDYIFQRNNTELKDTYYDSSNVKCVAYHAQLLTLMDCHYRHVDDFSHILIIDTDEFIVPLKSMTLLDMFTEIQASKSYANAIAYSFVELCFDNSLKKSNNLVNGNNAQLMTRQFLRNRYFRYKDDMGWHHKSVIIPSLVKGVQVHEPFIKLHGHDNIVVIDPDIGELFHYRTGMCFTLGEDGLTDRTMEKYLTALKSNMNKILNQFGKKKFLE